MTAPGSRGQGANRERVTGPGKGNLPEPADNNPAEDPSSNPHGPDQTDKEEPKLASPSSGTAQYELVTQLMRLLYIVNCNLE